MHSTRCNYLLRVAMNIYIVHRYLVGNFVETLEDNTFAGAEALEEM